MFDTRDKRAAAQGMILFPMMPDPDGAAFSEGDRRQVQGIYPYTITGITIGAAVGLRGRHGFWERSKPSLLGQYVMAIDKSRDELV